MTHEELSMILKNTCSVDVGVSGSVSFIFAVSDGICQCAISLLTISEQTLQSYEWLVDSLGQHYTRHIICHMYFRVQNHDVAFYSSGTEYRGVWL